MPVLAVDRDDRITAMRSAVLATLGVALWLGASLVFVLALPFSDNGSGDVDRWALVLRWLISNGGALLVLIGAHGLAKGVSAALRRPQDVNAAAAGKRRSGRDPALVLVVVGLALNAFSESLSFAVEVDDSLPPVYGATTLIAAYAAPVALTLGIYLALRRLAELIAVKPLSAGAEPARTELGGAASRRRRPLPHPSGTSRRGLTRAGRR